MKRDLPEFEVGDFVRVMAVPPRLNDLLTMGTLEVFEGAVGKVFPIEEIDEHGWLSLVVSERHPTEDTYESDTIWIEPEHVALAEATADGRLTDEQARRERFYEEKADHRRAEFINGEVFVQPPSMVRHIDVVGSLTFLPGICVDLRDIGWAGIGKLVCLTRNDYRPDVVFYGQKKALSLPPDQVKLPAPDFIAEVLSPSTEQHDRRVKFVDYAAHGITEYWIIDPVGQVIEQYALPMGGTEYQMVGTWSGDTEIIGVAVPGFHLPARVLFDRQANLAALAALT